MSDNKITLIGGQFVLVRSQKDNGLAASYKGVQLPVIPVIPQDAQEIYDMIMGQIEPELTTSMLPLLEAKYQNESPEDAKKRAERYSKAFEDYQIQFERYVFDLKQSLTKYQKQAIVSLEKGDRMEEAAILEEEMAILADTNIQ